MAIKVLKQGKVPIEIKWVLECYHCHSVLEYSDSDLKSGQYNEQIVECPVCDYYLDHSPEKSKKNPTAYAVEEYVKERSTLLVPEHVDGWVAMIINRSVILDGIWNVLERVGFRRGMDFEDDDVIKFWNNDR